MRLTVGIDELAINTVHLLSDVSDFSIQSAEAYAELIDSWDGRSEYPGGGIVAVADVNGDARKDERVVSGRVNVSHVSRHLSVTSG